MLDERIKAIGRDNQEAEMIRQVIENDSWLRCGICGGLLKEGHEGFLRCERDKLEISKGLINGNTTDMETV